MRAAFHQAGDDHGVAARQPAHRAGVIEFAQPAVTRLVACQRPRFACIVGRHGLPQMDHAQVRAGGQACESQGGAERVFFLAQVPDDGDKAIAAWRRLAFDGAHRLVDNAGLGAQPGAELGQAFRLQHDHAVGEAQRFFRAGVAADIAVQVGAG